jgi:hypothetical protein
MEKNVTDVVQCVLPRVKITEGCWLWLGGHNAHQRPYYQNKLVYRILFEYYRYDIPPGLVLDHEVCDTPWCVNPWHVEPKTQKDNLLRAGVTKNLGVYNIKGNTQSINNLGKYGGKGQEHKRDALGRFIGG